MNKLKINQKVEVEFKSNKYPDIYLAKVADFVDSGIVITGLYQQGTPLTVNRNDNIHVYFTTDRAAYEFETVVLQRLKKPIYFILIKEPEELKRIQRRDYFRLEFEGAVKLHKEKADGAVKEKGVKLIDLSGGGIQIKTKAEFKVGELVKISFKKILKLSELVQGEIVRKKKNTLNSYRYGIKFVDLDRRDREKIIQWIFNMQRQLRKKGLGK